MGTMDRGGICTTDGANANDSPGYFGHIALARPVYHIGFIKTVIRVLRCVSYHTSRLLVDKVRGRGRGAGQAVVTVWAASSCPNPVKGILLSRVFFQYYGPRYSSLHGRQHVERRGVQPLPG